MSKSSGIISKRNARALAVQFMYKLQMSGDEAVSESGVSDFIDTYAGDEVNVKFFKKLVADFNECPDLERMITDALNEGKAITNSPPVEVCIIKAALAEMICETTDIPVIINEYVEITKDFLGDKDARFVNALLDKVSKKVERKCQHKV